MSTIFSETIARAISDYRYLLRRYLSQADRMAKLNALSLRDAALYESDVALFEVASKIIADIEETMDTAEKGYYSYSGIAHFCNYLKEFLKNYEIDNNKVVHKAQKASRTLIYVIQLFMKPEADLTPEVAADFVRCNTIIAENGAVEQKELYLSNLERHKDIYPSFYAPLLNDFQLRVAASAKGSEKKVAPALNRTNVLAEEDEGNSGMEEALA